MFSFLVHVFKLQLFFFSKDLGRPAAWHKTNALHGIPKLIQLQNLRVWHRERFTALIFRWPKLQLTTGSANHQPLLETLIKQYNLSLVSMTPSVPITTSALCKISSVKSSFLNDLSLFCLHINLLYYYFDNKSTSWPKWS